MNNITKLLCILLFASMSDGCVSFTMTDRNSTAIASTDFPKMLQTWKDGNPQTVHDQVYLAYTDDQLSELLPVLTTWIPIQDELESHPDDSWKALNSWQEWFQFINALPPGHPIRRKFRLSGQAASTIRVLAENRRIDQEFLLPILIEGVSHPYSLSTGRNCFYALTALTRLYYGSALRNELELHRDAALITEWFRAWYISSQGKRRIVTVDMEHAIQRECLSLSAYLETLVSDHSHNLNGFRAPTERVYHGSASSPLFDIKWDGRFIATRLTYPGGQGALRVVVRPQVKLIEGIVTFLDDFKSFPAATRMIYSKTFDETDWALEVYVDRLTDTEIETLSSSLRKRAEQGDKAIRNSGMADQ